MYPTKKQMVQWLIEHKKKSNCNYWYWHNCHWEEGGCKKKYLCEIFQYGICYYYHKKYIHKNKCYNKREECFIKKKYNQCNFITYLKSPLRLV